MISKGRVFAMLAADVSVEYLTLVCKDTGSLEIIRYLWLIVQLHMREASGDWVTFSFPFFHILREDLAHNPQRHYENDPIHFVYAMHF